METKYETKYKCLECDEKIHIKSVKATQLTCPRCGKANIIEDRSECLESLPPSWDFQCQECKAVFRVSSPRGPDEVKSLKCPLCRAIKPKWIAVSTEACGTGG